MNDQNEQLDNNREEEDDNDDDDDEFFQQASFVAALIGEYAVSQLCKEPCRTSELSGHAWVQEILQGNSTRCYEMFRMEKHIFNLICTKLVEHGLKSSKRMGVEEMVAMFLVVVGHGVGNRMIQERFQHSGETVSRHFHRVLRACLKLSMKYIKPEGPTFHDCHSKIKNDQRYWPFFKNAIGAINGTHVSCVVNANEQTRYIGRKGYPTQNIMAVCDWNMCFTFVLAGWEGTAHDARVFDQALTNVNLNFPHPPPGKYYLVDSGYPTPIGYIGPYRCERYHLPDFRRSNGFANNNEVFNYYHSSLRCTIERTFGVWKNRFAILRCMPKFKFQTQVQIVVATMTIHNFIRRNAEIDVDFNLYEDENTTIHHDDYHISPNLDQSQVLNVASSLEMDHVRDSIRNKIIEYKLKT
ncbi:uncharacterized protein LOC127104449 [Lathyrus oleraceus]|uniref:uncharacterized protein LOC127104449 n=1 Tax=Pisum sativum TaxID=3888 RepID=UPI0021D16191|nr:uncharacterized protein LOC127104449 [Pisum sativum]